MRDVAPANTSYTEGAGKGITFVAGVASDGGASISNSDDDDDGMDVAQRKLHDGDHRDLPGRDQLHLRDGDQKKIHGVAPANTPFKEVVRKGIAFVHQGFHFVMPRNLPADPPASMRITREAWERFRTTAAARMKAEEALPTPPPSPPRSPPSQSSA
eukprot:2922741-Prymnesium_polylepis.1